MTPDVAPPADGVSKDRTEALREKLSRHLDRPLVGLTLTRNRVRFLSARVVEGGLEVRLQRAFLEAPDPVLTAIARLCDPALRGRPRADALDTARRYFAEHGAEPRRPPPPARLRSRGTVHDLGPIRDRLERDYFDGNLPVRVTWSRSRRGNADLRRGGIHLRLGSYEASRRLVRIHPVLDREEVPRYVVEAVLYHEMLHAAVPPVRRGRRRRVHTAEFLRRERRFRHHQEAERWIATNIRRLARWRNDEAGRPDGG